MQDIDLYQIYRLDRDETSVALGIILAGREAMLANQGLPVTSPRRKQVSIAYAILSDDSRRALYDEALDAGRKTDWNRLEHLGNFNDWPQEYTGWTEPEWESAPQPEPLLKPVKSQNKSPYPNFLDPSVDPTTGPTPVPNPLAYHTPAPPSSVLGRPAGAVDYASMAQRPPVAQRAMMALLDTVLFFMAFAVLTAPLQIFGADDVYNPAFLGLMFVLYMVIPEVRFGGSPAKLILGYEVRDEQTKKRLTYQQSLKRNWFRLVQVIPGIGVLAAFIGTVVSLASINTENGQRGSHDRFAGAEIVKKQ